MKSRTVWSAARNMAPQSFLLAVIHLSAYVYGNVSVEQWPPTAQHSTGENTTLFCRIRADRETNITKCRIDWYRQSEDGRLPEIRQLLQFRGRFQEHVNDSQWSSNLSLTALELNDTGRFFCNYFCLINRTLPARQYGGTGTNLSVYEEKRAPRITDAVISTTTINAGTFDEETTNDVLFTILLFLPLSLKLVVSVFLCTYTLFSFYVRCYCLFSFTHLIRI